MNKIILVFITITSLTFSQVKTDNKLYTEILQKYVENGLVNYKDLLGNTDFDKYLSLLEQTHPNLFENQNDELAYWINSYNAFTLKIILENYPLESINDLHSGGRILSHVFGTTIWDEKFIKINGEELSLNNIEHDIIREKFKVPEVHFTLVCASISCPNLREEAYSGKSLTYQLEDQARIFFNDKSKNVFDLENQVANISKILDWYDDDFGNSDKEILKFIAKYLPKNISDKILQNIEEWEIEYLDYDWGLNERKDK